MTALGPRLRVPGLLLLAGVVAIVAAVYAQVWHAEFVWDDKLCMRSGIWLGDSATWRDAVVDGNCPWSNYFRPFAVAVLALQLRVFEVQPGPMHVVSLLLHLTNTLLVLLLARRLMPAEMAGSKLPALFALIFGLHPALVEPVVWISCQFELLLTLFSLLALLFNAAIAAASTRAAAVALAFFLAACSKEAACVLPALVFLGDVYVEARRNGNRGALLGQVMRRQAWVYGALVAAGVAYLALRFLSFGHALLPTGRIEGFGLARFQEVMWTYVSYLRVVVWPMVDLGPLHEAHSGQFAAASWSNIAADAGGLAVVVAGVVLALRRKGLGLVILAVSAALLPVLHVVPLAFTESVFHERYAMLAVAVACSMLPGLFATGSDWSPRIIRILGMPVALLWLGMALLAVRSTIPLWSTDLNLWRWAVERDPRSALATGNLLTAYASLDDPARARQFADNVIGSDLHCPNCVLNAASIYVAQGDAARAEAALARLDHERSFLYDRQALQFYLLTKGGLLELQGDAAGAEVAYRESIRLSPLDPAPRVALALLLARSGRTEDARAAISAAIELLAPNERAEAQSRFEAQLRSATR